ncbi:MAG: phosphatase PAP2 family protein [Acidimicrobiales bacterium]
MKVLARHSPEFFGGLFIASWFGLPREDYVNREALFTSVLAGTIAIGVNNVISRLWFRPRPFAALPASDVRHLIDHEDASSFPSDHVAGALAFSFGLAGRPPTLARLFGITSVTVGLSRLYTGVHWPSDLAGGAIVGYLSARIARRLAPGIRPLVVVGMRLSGVS